MYRSREIDQSEELFKQTPRGSAKDPARLRLWHGGTRTASRGRHSEVRSPHPPGVAAAAGSYGQLQAEGSGGRGSGGRRGRRGPAVSRGRRRVCHDAQGPP